MNRTNPIIKASIAAKTITYDFHRRMEAATLRKCSEFGNDIVKHMEWIFGGTACRAASSYQFVLPQGKWVICTADKT